ncbi:hypothetical protein ACPV40_13225 [Vibrio alfacsensis]|uniref:hypothetical protein n=1 Tax=Vibrio alfacsensis TaxID=1074311 RepID=UPI004068AB6C
MNRVIEYFRSVVENPWIILTDIMNLVVIACGIGVVCSFAYIFYALAGGTGADLINPSSW